MALIDRLARDETSERHIANHEFSAACYLWAIGEITRQNVVDSWAMTVDDQVQLDQLGAYYQSLDNADKQEWHPRLEACGVLLEGQKITRAQYKNLLGLT